MIHNEDICYHDISRDARKEFLKTDLIFEAYDQFLYNRKISVYNELLPSAKERTLGIKSLQLLGSTGLIPRTPSNKNFVFKVVIVEGPTVYSHKVIDIDYQIVYL